MDLPPEDPDGREEEKARSYGGTDAPPTRKTELPPLPQSVFSKMYYYMAYQQVHLAAAPASMSAESSTPPATPTLSESSRSSCSGKTADAPERARETRTSALHSRRTDVRRPLPSEPSTSTIGAVGLSSFTVTELSNEAPATVHPASLASLSVRTRLRVEWTVISSIAPAEARETAGVSGAEFFSETRTPAAPKKSAERSNEPRFCGSVTSSRASQTGRAPPSGGGGSERIGLKFSFSASSAIPWCGRLFVIKFSRCLSTRSTGTPASVAIRSAVVMSPPSLRLASTMESWSSSRLALRRPTVSALRTDDTPYT
eukprot:scaffold278463_cov28-Tisochrysis_lutea.AAC.2